ncbi:hypothetical protein [Kineosporia sp. NBRC 101731]|uniref:hypothetical protein n=1 Tax=Kineosporia sp. NBRC 101731 TaxID=3032199 RepID=UPI0024A51EA0|nr:hypothetical protein [Kineosporia sp. NBRC 101731]GLY28229.1 hypothetical protein Kisp02_15940 [Kineosporia sp. NBRC 101731]
MNRVVSAARLHTIGGQSISVPWSVLVSALAINFLIFGTIQAGDGIDEDPTTGGLLALYAVTMVVFIQAMNKPLSFALGFGLTRRTYLFGTALFALALSFGSAVVLYALYGLEQATGGWWMDLSFFGVVGLGEGNPVVAVLGYAAPMTALTALGALTGGINARWGLIGVYTAAIVTLIAGGVFAVIMFYAHAWTSLGHWIADQPSAALFAGYPWIVTAVAGAGAYAVVRRVAA